MRYSANHEIPRLPCSSGDSRSGQESRSEALKISRKSSPMRVASASEGGLTTLLDLAPSSKTLEEMADKANAMTKALAAGSTLLDLSPLGQPEAAAAAKVAKLFAVGTAVQEAYLRKLAELKKQQEEEAARERQKWEAVDRAIHEQMESPREWRDLPDRDPKVGGIA